MGDHSSQKRYPTYAQACEPSGPGVHSNPIQEYHALARQLQEDAPDEAAHHLDTQVAWIMANYGGYTPAAIKQAMREASVHLARHGGDAQAYVDRTVEQAMQEDPYGDIVLGWGE
jgi:hypothetical protein